MVVETSPDCASIIESADFQCVSEWKVGEAVSWEKEYDLETQRFQNLTQKTELIAKLFFVDLSPAEVAEMFDLREELP